MLNMGFRGGYRDHPQRHPRGAADGAVLRHHAPAILAITWEFQTDPEMVEIRGTPAPSIRWSRPPTTCPRAENGRPAPPAGISSARPFHHLLQHQSMVVEQLGESYLNNAGIGCEVLHGDMKQSARTQVMDRFKSRRVSILIATDVAARGIDVDDVDAVFNFDIPKMRSTTSTASVGPAGQVKQ